MTKFRLIYFDATGKKWYAIGQGLYGANRRHAELFTDDDYEAWGKERGLTKEELGENRRADEPPLLSGMEEL